MHQQRPGILGRCAAWCVLAAALAACQGRQTTLDPAGPAAGSIFRLFSFLWITAAVVFVAVMAALAYAVAHGRSRAAADTSPEGERRVRRTVTIATAVTAAILMVFLVASYLTGRAYAVTPLGGRPLQVSVIGHQWWWEVVYSDSITSRSVTTANEIHVPTGRNVVLKLSSTDVIHSFWVPNLSGKKDLIPGYGTTTWFRVDRPGIYRGQCAEFCGHQHANMGLLVIAESPARFADWYERQLQPSDTPAAPLLRKGQQAFLDRSCVMCHTVRGTPAGSHVGPDLTHVGGRMTLAAATIPNNRGYLGGWVLDPQGIKPGAHMPPNDIPASELQALLSYLESLR